MFLLNPECGIVSPLEMNCFGFARNNPIKFTDPSGLFLLDNYEDGTDPYDFGGSDDSGSEVRGLGKRVGTYKGPCVEPETIQLVEAVLKAIVFGGLGIVSAALFGVEAQAPGLALANDNGGKVEECGIVGITRRKKMK